MQKILIAIKDNFTRNLYKEVLEKQGYNILIAEQEDKLLVWTKLENPNIILIDIGFFRQEDFEKQFIKQITDKKIPVIAFAQFQTQENKERAMDLGAKDFISSSETSPAIVIRKVKILMGEQRTYQVGINLEDYDGLKLVKDILGRESITCPKCNSSMVLYLIRDLSQGGNYYKVSIKCPNCL
ncbi:MAG: response regulator [Candidatus Pacebacteria bacterium]|nr:response regulator [Candidatus Paceibacterota bacterium]